MEVLTAVGILAIISTMTMAVFVKQMHHGAQEDNRRAAVNLMDDFIEKIYRVNINQLPNIVNTGGFDETYGQVPGHPLFSRRIKTFQQLPTQEPSYLIEVEIRWKYRDGESPSYTQWITKTQLGGN
jgi:hypothetical protein